MIARTGRCHAIGKGFAGLLLFGVIGTLATAARAQQQGGSIQKTCVNNATNLTSAQPGDVIRCTIRFTNRSTSNVRVDSIRDSVHHGSAAADDGTCVGPPLGSAPTTCSPPTVGVNCVTSNLLFEVLQTLPPGASGKCVNAANTIPSGGTACTRTSIWISPDPRRR